VATLDRQCERLASAMATNIPAGDVGGNIYYVVFHS
jgi:homeobox-leucine zipper protein